MNRENLKAALKDLLIRYGAQLHKIYSMVSADHRPTYYKLDPTAPQRSFTQEQLQVIPDDTQLPPSRLQ